MLRRSQRAGAATAARGGPGWTPGASGRLPGRAGPEGVNHAPRRLRLSGRRRSFVMRPRRRRSVIIAVVVAALVIALGAAGGSYLWLRRTVGSPSQTAAAYLSAWQRGAYPAMDKVSLNVPRSGLAGPLKQAAAELGVRRLRLSPGRVTAAGGSAQAQFTATAVLASGHTWTIPGPAAPDQQEPALVGELEPGRDLSGAAPRRPVRAQRRVAGPGAGARGRRHRAQLPGGDRQVRVPGAADRQRGRGHRRPGEEARPPVQGRRPDRPGRDRAGLPAAAGGPAVADDPHRGSGPSRQRHRGALPRGGREARADEHRHADAAGRVAGRVLRGDGQAG